MPKRRRLVHQVYASSIVVALDDVVRTPGRVSDPVVSVTVWGGTDGPK